MSENSALLHQQGRNPHNKHKLRYSLVRNLAFGVEYISNVSMTFHYANVYMSEKLTQTTSCYFSIMRL
jgi:hypothetical protein